MAAAVTADLYVWHAPRDLSSEAADAMLTDWSQGGQDPAAAPFEPSTDVGWFSVELRKERPTMEVASDVEPSVSSRPIWLETTPAEPARFVAIRLSADLEARHAEIELVFSLAAKYDLVVFEPAAARIHLPLEELAAYAEATFWPAGAIRAFVAGAAGTGLAFVAYVLGIPIVSGLLVVVGGFVAVMAVYTFLAAGRQAWRGRRVPEDTGGRGDAT